MEITPEREELIRERFIRNNNFPRLLGVELDLIEPGRARLTVEVSDRLRQPQGVMHGGAIASVIDTSVALAIASTAGPEARFTTIDMTVTYLSPVIEGRIFADARIIRQGRRVVAAECDVSDEHGKRVAKALLTYIFLNSNQSESK
ncbi:MAG TPA: PaaI family thioesterase [Blastocatellia bacterium]|nr:PaaI family thioesterase [Blastocatellia bacterium]